MKYVPLDIDYKAASFKAQGSRDDLRRGLVAAGQAKDRKISNPGRISFDKPLPFMTKDDSLCLFPVLRRESVFINFIGICVLEIIHKVKIASFILTGVISKISAGELFISFAAQCGEHERTPGCNEGSISYSAKKTIKALIGLCDTQKIAEEMEDHFMGEKKYSCQKDKLWNAVIKDCSDKSIFFYHVNSSDFFV